MELIRVRVYTPKSQLQNPMALFREMLSDLGASRELAWRLFIRDISALYRQSFLGYVLAFIPLIVVCVPFVYLNSQGIVVMKDVGMPYAAYCLIGTTIWQVFVDSLNSPLKTVIAAKPMLSRINFPREAIVLSGLGQVLFSFLIRLVVLVGVFLWYDINLPPTFVLFPLGILGLVVVGFTIGLAITPLGLLYSDIQHTLPIASMFLMFFTPILYPVPTSGLAAAVASWNPLTPLVSTTRDWITIGESATVGPFILISVIAFFSLLFSWILYRLALPHIVARIGN